MAEKNTTTERWRYAGARVDHRGKLIHRWMDGADEEKLFGQNLTRGALVGAIYEVEVERHAEEGLTVHGHARLVSPDLDERAGRWKAEHQGAQAQVEMKRAASKHDPMEDLTLGEIREMMRGRLAHQRAGLLGAVIRYVGG